MRDSRGWRVARSLNRTQEVGGSNPPHFNSLPRPGRPPEKGAYSGTTMMEGEEGGEEFLELEVDLRADSGLNLFFGEAGH